MMRFSLILAVTVLAAMPALADLSSTRPMPRPAQLGGAATTIIASETVSPGKSIRPESRPGNQASENQNSAKKGFWAALLGPKKKPSQKPSQETNQQSASGSVCKDRAIRGTAIPSIRGAQEGCGVEAPVRITEVDGLALSTPATLDCDTARALRKWVTNKLKPAFGRNEVVGLRIAAHYACRGRNNKKSARISEHGRGKAIDISGFKLANGTEVTVLDDYKSNRGKPIRKAHKGACGIFGTTLGPGSDGHHRDHLHLDTAKYRGGPYCK
jgi:hypothetical protein